MLYSFRVHAKGFQAARRDTLVCAGQLVNHVLWDGEAMMARQALRFDRQKQARGVQVVGVAPALGSPP